MGCKAMRSPRLSRWVAVRRAAKVGPAGQAGPGQVKAGPAGRPAPPAALEG